LKFGIFLVIVSWLLVFPPSPHVKLKTPYSLLLTPNFTPLYLSFLYSILVNMQNPSKVGAVIVAAGESLRMNGIDKVLASLGGKPVLAWSVDALQQSPQVDRIVIVVSRKNMETVLSLKQAQKWTKVIQVCPGGTRRQDSVAAGLQHLGVSEWVIIQDGARPFLTQELILQGLKSALSTGVAVAAVPVVDTVKLVNDDLIVIDTPPRDKLWAAQTPQIFRWDIITGAYRLPQEDVTDDASLAERLGYPVQLFRGSYDNIKITTPRDLALAEVIIQAQEINWHN
jgi:2-C-methyl-D-erythritol 4-phosphate cytidylyltransferase